LNAVVLQASGLGAGGHYRNVDLTLRRGEVTGIAGVIGSGREELIRTFFGFMPHTAGPLAIDGIPRHLKRPADAVARGIGYIPRERRVEGLVMFLSVATNMTLGRLDTVMAHGLIDHAREGKLARDWIGRLAIKVPGPESLCLSLSGGNQQKVVL